MNLHNLFNPRPLPKSFTHECNFKKSQKVILCRSNQNAHVLTLAAVCLPPPADATSTNEQNRKFTTSSAAQHMQEVTGTSGSSTAKGSGVITRSVPIV